MDPEHERIHERVSGVAARVGTLEVASATQEERMKGIVKDVRVLERDRDAQDTVIERIQISVGQSKMGLSWLVSIAVFLATVVAQVLMRIVTP